MICIRSGFFSFSETQTLNICKNQAVESPSVMVTSPNYPSVLPGNTDCQCNVSGSVGQPIIMFILDISLGMHQELCHDWLKVEFPSHVGSQLVTCGYLKQPDKALQMKRHEMIMHFHTARGVLDVFLVGFQIKLKGKV